MDPFTVSVVAILSIFGIAPAIVFGFIFLSKKQKVDLEKLKIQYQIQLAQLEQKQLEARILESESKHYDRLIDEHDAKNRS